MAAIDPDGMFYGDRMAKLSLMARLYWAYFYVASNGYARIEINYSKLINTVFSSFPVVPTRDEVSSYVIEYHESYLLFVYQANGQIWGQWDTSEKYLPYRKTAKDHASPVPNPEKYEKWKQEYLKAKITENEANSNGCNLFENMKKDFGNSVRGLGSGSGSGIGLGIGKGRGEGVGSSPPPVSDSPALRNGDGGFDFEAAFEEIWMLYPEKGRTRKPLSQQTFIAAFEGKADHGLLFSRMLAPLTEHGRWARSEQWGKGMVFAIADYFQNSRWDENPPGANGSSNGSGTAKPMTAAQEQEAVKQKQREAIRREVDTEERRQIEERRKLKESA